MSTADEIRSQTAKEASDIIQSLLKAKKGIRLYPSTNPVYLQLVDNTYQKFKDFFDYSERLELGIARSDILFEGEPVYHEEGKDENLALFFFRDGLRSLSFEKGLEKDELRDFLQIITIDFDNELVEDDVVTLLWEKDFRNIKYTVDENVLGEDDGYEKEAVQQAKEGALEEESIQHAYEEALAVEDMEVVPQMPLTEDDLKVLALEVQKDAESKMGKLADIIFNMLYLAETFDEFRDMVRVLNRAVEFCVKHAFLKDAALIFRRVEEMIYNTGSEEVKKILGKVLSHAGSPPFIKLIGEQLESKEGVKEEDFREYVSFLDSGAIPAFMEILGELQTISARRNIINALAYLGKNDISILLKGLKDKRWYVVRNIIHVLRLIGNKGAVENLMDIAGHHDPRVRKEVMRALGEFGGPLTAETVQIFLDDPDSAVRSAAVRALGSIGSDYARTVLIRRLSDRRVLSVGISEMKESFEVLSRWKDGEVFSFLMDVLQKNPFFGRAKYNEYKACAVHCLGLLGNKDALEELEKLRNSKNGLLSEHAGIAVKRILHANR